jgi:hypothetical protein
MNTDDCFPKRMMTVRLVKRMGKRMTIRKMVRLLSNMRVMVMVINNKVVMVIKITIMVNISGQIISNLKIGVKSRMT